LTSGGKLGVVVGGEIDLVIRGGLVADGTGGPLRTADVAVADGRIVAVGRVSERGVREVDADGALVAPGWVDIHTHYDGQATWDSSLAPSSAQGVTSVVFGNCGVGFAPVHASDHDRLVTLMEGVEDIPGTALHEGLPWGWEAFEEYLDALEHLPHDVDFAAQVPHGALRVYVMGDRGASGRPATEADIEVMAELTCRAIRAGAVGFSTSRTLNHRSSTGDPTPSLTASGAELAGIGRGMRAADSGVVQLISDLADLDAEWAVIRGIAEASGRPLSMTLLQNGSVDRSAEMWPWREVLKRVEQARADNLAMSVQVAPRAIGLIFGLSVSLHPFVTNPVFAEIAQRPLDGQVRALSQAEFRKRLIDAQVAVAGADKLGGKLIVQYDRMVRLADPPDYQPSRLDSVAAHAEFQDRRPEDLVLDWLLGDDGRALLYLPVFNYLDWNFDAVRTMLVHPFAVPGLSDGGAHVGTICDGSFPTYLLSFWGRERESDRLPVEWIVQRQARATALAVGLADRGLLAPGYRADLNVIDFERLQVRRPTVRYDLPAGGRRLLQQTDGYQHTFLAGVETFTGGQPTGARPGRLVRGRQPDPG
jgi:N-acyl-D-aspartate/D-glutamate deacylase